MIFIGGDELRAVVPMADAIAAIRDAFIRIVDGSAEQPLRLALDDGSTLAMVARAGVASGTVAKLVSIRPENCLQGLPRIHGLAVWFDADTGRPLFILDGGSLTALRTGAASGVATDLLAPRDARVLGLVGAGGQAADQARAVLAVRPIEEVRIASRRGISAAELAGRLQSEFAHVSFSSTTVKEAVAAADVVCCATDSAAPVIFRAQLADRVHINAIGSYRPEMREIDERILRAASLIAVDDLHAATTESGEIISALQTRAIAEDSLKPIGQVALQPPRVVDGLTLFKSVGVAIQDWAIAQFVSGRLPAIGHDGSMQRLADAPA